jgi:GAF domain-containing protein
LADTQYLITLGGMLLIGIIISKLASSQKGQIEQSQKRQKEVIGLYELSRDLASAHSLEAVCRTVLEYIQQIFQAEAAVLLSNGRELEVFMHTPGFEPDENEIAVASWAYKNVKPARRGGLPPAFANCRREPYRGFGDHASGPGVCSNAGRLPGPRGGRPPRRHQHRARPPLGPQTPPQEVSLKLTRVRLIGKNGQSFSRILHLSCNLLQFSLQDIAGYCRILQDI